MKQAKISKVLALVLACVMVFTTLPLFAFAADESETYTVSYGAPAILMNKNTKVNLADISVEMDAEGTTVSGADITWAAEAQDGIVFNAAAKTVTAMAKGVYKLTATSSDVTKNVWVMVKEEEEDKFYLVNLPQLNKDTFVADDWRIFGSINNTDVTVSDALTNGIITLTNDYVQISHKYSETDSSLKKGSTIVYVHEIFKDFADYTVEASVSSNSATTVTDTGAGVGGRITLNEKETGFTTGILSYIRQTKVPAITRTNNEYGPHGTAVTTTPYTTWTGYSAYHTVKTIYDGNHFTYYYDTDMLYEYTSTPPSCTCTNTKCIFRNTIPGAGYPAVVGFGATARIASFNVYLNSNELAPATDVSTYTVSYTAPAIPMNENTAVDLSFINVEMDAEGTLASGDKIVWDAAKQDGLYLNKDAGVVSVYASGTYKLTATYEGVTKNVWVVVKKREEDKFYLVNLPELNSNTFIADDWRIFGSMNNTDVTVSQALETGIIAPTGEYVGVAQKFSETDSSLKKGGTLVYAHEMFKDFADYTVEASVSSGAANTVTDAGAGVGGRVTLNENETGYTTGILSYIRQTKVAAITRTNNDFGPHGTAVDKDAAGKYYTWQGLNDYHTVKNVYDGNKFSFYYDNGDPIYEYTSTPGTCTCSNSACIFKNTIPGAGYPAVVGFGASARIASFSVYLNSYDLAPTIDYVAYDANNLKIAVNTVFDLAHISINFGNKTVLGNEANIDNVRDVNGEVSNGQFVGFSVGEVTVTANYEGETTSFTVKVVDDGSENVNADEIADNTVVIEPIISDATDSAYYVTVTPEQGKELAALGLSIYENGKKLSSYQCADATGNKFRFETLGIETVNIETEYIEEGVASVAPIGATVRVADANNTAGIKFGNRVNIVTTDGNKITLDGTTNIKLGDTIIENVTVKEIGTLIIPSALIDGESLYATKNVKRGKATAVSASTAQHSDITAVLVNIPEAWYNLPISARAYIAYTVEGDSTVYYYYGDVIERTYNEVYTAAQPARHYYNAETGKYGQLIVDDGTIQDNTETTIKVELVLEGGTDHYLDTFSQTDDISYMIGETITYAFRIKGNYKLRYMVYKDDADDNLYGNEVIGIDTQNDPGTNKYVKQGVYEGDVFKFSTKMNKAGAIQVKLEVLDSNDKVVSMFRHTVIVDFDNIEPAVEAPTYYYDENGEKVESTVAEFYAASKNEWAPMLAKIRAEVNSDEFKAYWSAKEADAVYDGTYIYATRKADVSGYYLYDIQLATEEPSEVLAGATKVSDLFADTTNKKFLYNDHTARPSSFNLTLKQGAADGSLGVTGSFQGYGDASSAGKTTSNSVLYVNMNSHGILNNQDSAYYTAIHKVKSLEGGTKGFFNEFNSTSDVGVEKSPTELYAYGIIKRDYFGLQFAKMLPEYNTESKNTVSGGSMGGFRSVLAAAFDPSIKSVNGAYTWMGSVGGRENGKVAGGFMPAHTIGIQYFSTVNAAATLGSDVTLNLIACGMGDYTSPPAGLVAVYNMATCKKSIELMQYREHGTIRTITHFEMKRTADAKNYATMPTGLDGKTMSEGQMLDAYRGYTDWRIYSISTNKDEIVPAAGNKAYYFSNNGDSSNDGLTPSTALATLDDLTNLESKLKAGDVVYFERGSIFRGAYTAEVDGVTYAAYGEGPKPEIYASRYNAAQTGEWVQTAENENVYVLTGAKKYGTDVGNIVFNGGEKHGIKCIIRTEDDGTYNNTTGRKFDSYADLDENLHFFHDTEDTDNLYLYCEDGNPGEIFESIEICVGTHIFIIRANNLRFDNISFKYGGAHGISTNTRKNLTVTNCEFQWLGGSIQTGVQYATNYPTRYGNGVEVYGGCDGFVVNNCYFSQIYDAAVTFQYNNKEATDIIMKDVDFSDNIMEYCNYSFEYFLTASDVGTSSYIKDVTIDNNLMWYAGYGLCEQRPDKADAAHVKAWEHYNSLNGTFTITNNLFAISRNDLVQSNARDASHSPTYSGNTYIQYTDGNLGTSRDVWDKVLFDSSVAAQIASMLGDNKSTVVYVQK